MEQLKRVKDTRTASLFSRTANFRVVQLGPNDAKKTSDDLIDLGHLISESQEMYPHINHWFSNRVVPGLRSSERIAYLAYENALPVASAVLKLGKNAKFCHLKIHRQFQDLDLGQMFFTQMAFEARHKSKVIHFTLPESLWFEKKHFFESFGFHNPVKSSRQYRLGNVEMHCSSPTSRVLSAAFEKLPHLMNKFSIGSYSFSGEILMSMKPQFAQRILEGKKTVEIRKKFAKKWVGSKVVLYASSPLCSLVGEATLDSIDSGAPEQIWGQFQTSIGCSREEFERYVGTAAEINAISLRDVVPYKSPVGLAQVSHLVNENLRPPQSFCDLKLEQGTPWAKAASIATLLHGRFTR